MKIMTFVLFAVLELCSNISHTDAGNILGLFPHPGYSHFRVFSPILYELAKRGHNVTVVSYFKTPIKHDNYHEIILIGEHNTTDVFDLTGQIPSRSFRTMYNEFWILADEGKEACEVFYKSKNVVTEILAVHKINPFDLVIMEFFNTDCLLGLVKILSAPFIGISSCALLPWHYDRVGLPDFPSFIPNEFVGFSEDMNYWERFVNFVVTKGTKFLYRLVEISDNEIIRKHLSIDMDVHEIAKETSLILVNQHYTLNGARPLSSKVVEVGGVHIDHVNRSLPKELEKFLSTGTDEGVIFISWGSMVKGSTIPKKQINSILNALKKIPQKIVWKWESNSLPIQDNGKFFFSRWIPQKDVLCHPSVKVFWSHGGLLGISEAVYCGKPSLVTPIYGDQFLNGKAVENRKVAEVLLFEDISEGNVYSNLKKLQSDNYTKNIELLSKAYRYRQNTPLDTALWWIEHVLDTNGNNFSYSPSIQMNSFFYYSIDVIGVFCIIILTFFFILLKCFCGGAVSRLKVSGRQSRIATKLKSKAA